MIAPEGKLRLDKWLWFARMFKTRTLAQKFVASDGVRINGTRITGPDYKIAAGTVLTFTLHTRVRILKVLDIGIRRGPAPEAALLYEDLSPPPLPIEEKTGLSATPALREPGSGRPTKKQRRDTEKLKNSDPA